MKIDIEMAVRFFDDTPDHGNATSIVGLIGEDLNAQAFKYFLENERHVEANILDIPITTGQQKGKRLDRWIHVKESGKEILYQCEIKNWSSTAIHGRKLKLDADTEETKTVADYYWNLQRRLEFADSKFPNGVTKVFVPMKKPDEYNNISVRPLLIYWMPISKNKGTEPFFSALVSELSNEKIPPTFAEFDIFSVSLYFRKLLKKGIKSIDLNMPNVEKRMDVLKRIII